MIKYPLRSSTLFLHLSFLTPLFISLCVPTQGYGCGREASRRLVSTTAKVTKGQCRKRTTTTILLHGMAALLFMPVRCRHRSGDLRLQMDFIGLAPLVTCYPPNELLPTSRKHPPTVKSYTFLAPLTAACWVALQRTPRGSLGNHWHFRT